MNAAELWSAPCSFVSHLLIGREKDGESMAIATHEYRSGSVLDRVQPVATRRQADGLTATAVRRSTGVAIDAEPREARVRGHAVALTHQEFDLLRILVTNRDIALDRAWLLEAAWKEDPYVTVRTVDAVIGALRKKVERDAENPEFILGTAHSGYRFIDAE
jgi:DNA-binding response OmpR family regulator